MTDFKGCMNVPVNPNVVLSNVDGSFRTFMTNAKKMPWRNLIVIPLDKPITEKGKHAVLSDFTRISGFVWDSNFIDLFDNYIDSNTECGYVKDVKYWPTSMSVDVLVTPILTVENSRSVMENMRSVISSYANERNIKSVIVLEENLREDMRFRYRENVCMLAPTEIYDIYLVEHNRK